MKDISIAHEPVAVIELDLDDTVTLYDAVQSYIEATGSHPAGGFLDEFSAQLMYAIDNMKESSR